MNTMEMNEPRLQRKEPGIQVEIRRAAIGELDLILQWRMEVLHQVFHVPETDPLTEVRAANELYYKEHLIDKGHIACFAASEEEILGCGGICLYSEMPSPDNPSGKCAYLMNIYTRAQYRGQGIGRKIVNWLIAQAREQGIQKIYLETSEDGRALYQNTGFIQMTDYMIYDR